MYNVTTTPNTTTAETKHPIQQEKPASRVKQFQRSISESYDQCKQLGHSGINLALDKAISLYSRTIQKVKDSAGATVKKTSQALSNNTPSIVKYTINFSAYEIRGFLNYLLNTPGVTLGLVLQILESIYGAEALADARAGLDSYKMDSLRNSAGKYFTDGPSEDTWGVRGSEFNQTIRVESACFLAQLCDQLLAQPLAERQIDLSHTLPGSTVLMPPVR